LARFEAAGQVYGELDDAAGQAEMLNNIGVLHRLEGNWPAAVTILKEAESLLDGIRDDGRRAQTLGNLGDVYAGQRDYKQAARCYSDAAQLFAGVGDRQKQADVLRAYSLMALRQRDGVTAMNLMAESLRVRPRRSLPQQLFFLLLRIVNKLMSGG
jgi:tetratricopeptide (TPR) repeat protein